MYRLIAFVFKHSHAVFLVAIFTFFLTVVEYIFFSSYARSSHSVANALRTSASFIMGLESPRALAPTTPVPGFVEITSWILCLVGWLLIPLCVGVMVSYGNRMREQQDDIDLRLLNVAKELGYDREKAKRYVKQQKERIYTLIDDERVTAVGIDDGREVGIGKEKH